MTCSGEYPTQNHHEYFTQIVTYSCYSTINIGFCRDSISLKSLPTQTVVLKLIADCNILLKILAYSSQNYRLLKSTQLSMCFVIVVSGRFVDCG